MEESMAQIDDLLEALESDIRQVLATTPSQGWLTSCMTNHIDDLKERLAEYQTRTADALRDGVAGLLSQGRDTIYEVQNAMQDAKRALDDVLFELETI